MSRKNSLKNILKIYVAPVAAAFFLKLLFMSLRWQRNDVRLLEIDEPMIGVFWHGRQLMLAPIFSDRKQAIPLSMLISNHADGVLISKAVSWFGIHTIHGSSSKGGSEAFLELKEALEHGGSVGITPDGPRGPIYQAKNGAAKLAALTGKKIFPVSYTSNQFWKLKSWDEMIIPKPFSKAVCIVGNMFTIPPITDEFSQEKANQMITDALNSVTKEVDTFFEK